MLSLTFVLLDIYLYEIGLFVVFSKNMHYVLLDIEHLPTTAGVIMFLRISH